MEKILHSAIAKWAAGLLMLLFLSLGIYYGLQVFAAVETGGIDVLLEDDIPEKYEDSKKCADTLAERIMYSIALQLMKQSYEEKCKEMTGTAMTVWSYDTWVSPAAADVSVERYDYSSDTEDSQEEASESEIREYTYEELIELRQNMEIGESDSTSYGFFEFENDIADGEQDIYVAVSGQQLVSAIKEIALLQAADGQDDAYDVDSKAYIAEIDGDIWTYDETSEVMTCSRFDDELMDYRTVYYNKAELDNHLAETDSTSLYTEDGFSEALLSSGISYFEGLIEYYTKDFDRLEEAVDEVESSISADVNYRYVVELNDGTVWTNVLDIKDIKEAASLYWSYDYSSGEISGTTSSELEEYLYSRLVEYNYSDYYADDYGYWTGDPEEFLQNNAKSISIALSEDMESDDILKAYKNEYESFVYLYQSARGNLAAAVVFTLLFLALLIYLLVVVGYQDNSGTLTKPSVSFRVGTELMLMLALVLVYAFIVAGYCAFDVVVQAAGDEVKAASIICIGVCWSVLPVCLELLSRIRHRQFWARSLCCRLVYTLVKKPSAWCRSASAGVRRQWKIFCSAMRIDVRLCAAFTASQIVLFILLAIGFICIEDAGSIAILLAFIMEAAVMAVVFGDIHYTAQIIQGVEELKSGNLDYQIPLEHMRGHKKELAESINHLQNGLKLAVEQSIKDERLKTELITNVSHDIKTPLTSIINYVDLLKQEPLEGENAEHYLEVLDQKSQRLKQLMEDLVEVSKSATGNVEFTPMKLDLIELLRQTLGEFEDKFNSRNLTVIENFKLDTAVVNLDSKHTFRVFENLCQNIYKYAMENSRVYVDVTREEMSVQIVMKNMSQFALNISADELMERFVRGDESRNTNGSGLGLSIAKNLVTLQQGAFYITLDGDLFKVTVTFPLAESIPSDMVMDEIRPD